MIELRTNPAHWKRHSWKFVFRANDVYWLTER